MPCGKTRRDQFRSQSEYEAHRERMMKLILGDDWRDQPLSNLVTQHPELHRISLPELLHRAHHLQQDQQEPAALPWTAEVIRMIQGSDVDGDVDTSTDERKPQREPLAIEAPKPRQTAEEWIRQYQRADVPEN